MLKQLLGKILRVQKLKEKLGFPSQQRAFNHLKQLGFTPKVILDIGAYEGHWASFIRGVFPDARVLLVEGQQEKEPMLKILVKQLGGSDYRIALLGAEKKEVNFNVYETASSVLEEDNPTPAITQKRQLTLLDELVPESFLPADLIKIDCQGYELEILKGGMRTLASASAVLLEVSFLEIYKGCPLAHEVIALMKANGFVVYDICSLMRRPYDRALYQSDLLFVRENSFLRSSTRWD